MKLTKRGGTMKRLRNLGVILLVSGIVGTLCLWHSIAYPWEENSCSHQAMAILKQRPNATIYWGMIYQPGHQGHGRWHVQPKDGKFWLTIDDSLRITESGCPQYNLLPRIKITAKKYKDIYSLRNLKEYEDIK